MGRVSNIKVDVIPRTHPLLLAVWTTTLVSIAAVVGFSHSLRADDEMDALFVRRISPLVQSKCLPCHGNGPELQGELDLRSRTGALDGGTSGRPVVEQGQPLNSPLFLAITRRDPNWSAMPPKEAEGLTSEQVGWFKRWIEGGAPWPSESRVRELTARQADRWSAEDGVAVETSGGQTPEWTHRRYKPAGLWAYQPVVKPTELRGNPVDALIAQQLPTGLAMAPPADRTTLIRRATFDLTGLPPMPAEVENFVRSPLPDSDAFELVVDRLLASPHYGERMAQHWLDVVRYADSSGFANDFERGNAWRYRDYVVRSFNSDKPYDQFVREQIAGDELDPNDPELLIATGFLRMGPWELTGMEVAKIARQRFLDDVTNGVGESFLAHSLQCARCHDHKFDPIPTVDYYSIQAVFATTQLAERSAPFQPFENVSGFEERRFLEERRSHYLAMLHRLDEKLLSAAEEWFQHNMLDPSTWHSAVEQALGQDRDRNRRGSISVLNEARTILAKLNVPENQYPPKLVGFTPQDFGNERVARKGLERLQWELDRYSPFALSVYSGRTPNVKSVFAPLRMPTDRLTTGELEDTCVLLGGDPFSTGKSVRPGTLSVIRRPSTDQGILVKSNDIPTAVEGRRRAFAEWVASQDNPLTARVIANRIWLWHFDRPIAGNPNNFGSTGRPPTHPKLLDWLAATLVEDGWSIKSLHRRIMNSETYRRSSRHPDLPVLDQLDPLGTSYAAFKPRRLTAEEIRDAMLNATGELNATVGGIPNQPEINSEAALQPRQVMGTFAAAWVANPLPSQRHRRSLYALKLRGLPDPFRDVFNSPAPDFSCERREDSNNTLQVLSMFNGTPSYSRALALAQRAFHDASGAGQTNQTGKSPDRAIVARCLELVYSRQPNSHEIQLCLDHWHELERDAENEFADLPVPPLNIVRDAVEENTGERFRFEERLFANAEFVPDLQPSMVSGRIRALANVCLALFNSNEFVFLD